MKAKISGMCLVMMSMAIALAAHGQGPVPSHHSAPDVGQGLDSTETPTVVEYLHILSTGQSLALGMTSMPALSTTQPYANRSLSPNIGGYVAPLVPLVEMNDMESPSSGLANTLHVLDSLGRPVVIGMHASGGAKYTDLKKGTAPWVRAMYQVSTTKYEVEAIGNTAYVPVGVTLVHGEADNYVGNAPYYKGYLEEWQQDYETDISAIMGQQISFPMYVSQMTTGWTGEMAVAQYQAHRDNPGKIILIGPKYQYAYSDDLHLINVESKHVGEMFAKVIHEVAVLGHAWNPLMPSRVMRDQNVITVDFHIPVGNLTIDTTTIPARPHYGFEFVQTGGNVVAITDVALSGSGQQVRITLDSVPTGTDQLLRYAYTCYHGGTGYAACGNGEDSSAVGGNIRDSDTLVSPAIGSTGLPLHNWCVTFEEPVVDRVVAVQAAAQPVVEVFPNPVDAQLHLRQQAGASPMVLVTLADLAGHEIQRWSDLGGDAECILTVGHLPSGLYMLAMYMEGGVAYRKVVVR
jgi:hypothetical protein